MWGWQLLLGKKNRFRDISKRNIVNNNVLGVETIYIEESRKKHAFAKNNFVGLIIIATRESYKDVYFGYTYNMLVMIRLESMR